MRLFRYAILAVLVLASGCSGGEKDTGARGTPSTGGTVTRRLASDCKTLNWVLSSTRYENVVLRHLYDRILDYDDQQSVVPVLAKRFHVGDDHLRITVHLRTDVRWHDGRPMTAADVKFTLDKILDPAVPASNKRVWFDKLDRLDVVDDSTVVFVWKEPYAPALHALTELAPIPKHVYEAGDFRENPANRHPVGTGAFKFEEWQTGQMIALVRNEDYYGKEAYLDRIIFKVIPDPSVALNALKTGQLDEMRINQPQWEHLTNDRAFLDRFDRHFYYLPHYNYLSWNCRSVWFRDKRVRRAMTMLFDREAITEQLYSGYAKIVTGPFYVNSWAYDQTVEPIPFDPEGAAVLLAESGWIDSDNDGIRDKEGKKFEFEFNIVGGGRTAQQFAELLQEQCLKVGINMEIAPLEGATFFEKVQNGNYTAVALSWQLDKDPDVFGTFHSSQAPPAGDNHGYYSNPRVDELIELARVEFDLEKRKELYHEIHRLINEDQPYTFVNSVPEKLAISKRIQNVVISKSGPFDFHPGANYWSISSATMEAKK